MKYKFNINTGHYERIYNSLNEEDEVLTSDSELKESNIENKSTLSNLENEDVLRKKQEMDNKINDVLRKLEGKKELLNQVKQQLSNALGKLDQTSVNNLLKKVLQAKKEISDIELEKAKIKNLYENQILQLQQSLIESVKLQNLPYKYRALNESNIQNAKVYVNGLIQNDEQERIKGMVDFKHMFCESDLLYGKDKNGYYAVCIDQEDFNKLTDTLEEAGYLKNDILACCLSLIFDRTNLVK